jgi:hypothetical protein
MEQQPLFKQVLDNYTQDYEKALEKDYFMDWILSASPIIVFVFALIGCSAFMIKQEYLLIIPTVMALITFSIVRWIRGIIQETFYAKYLHSSLIQIPEVNKPYSIYWTYKGKPIYEDKIDDNHYFNLIETSPPYNFIPYMVIITPKSWGETYLYNEGLKIYKGTMCKVNKTYDTLSLVRIIDLNPTPIPVFYSVDNPYVRGKVMKDADLIPKASVEVADKSVEVYHKIEANRYKKLYELSESKRKELEAMLRDYKIEAGKTLATMLDQYIRFGKVTLPKELEEVEKKIKKKMYMVILYTVLGTIAVILLAMILL